MSCERLGTVDDVVEILESAEAPLDDPVFCDRFDRLYNNLRDNTHVWELRGFTPDQYGDATGKTIRRFRLPRK